MKTEEDHSVKVVAWDVQGLGYIFRTLRAYHFCRAEPGIHVVLSGTGNPRHLEQNVASIMRPPLPEAVRRRLVHLFAGVDTVSGQ